MNQADPTLLNYYQQHQISPVSYDLTNIDAHLERRNSLYLKLGIVPIAFRQAKILEVAAGTGHNSLYLAKCMPEKLVLLEPNISGIKHIQQIYQAFIYKHVQPLIINQTLENYETKELFDIVVCENWLGTSSHELSLLQKLNQLVCNQGMLILTSVSPIGIVPNLLRRFFAIYLTTPTNDFKEKTDILVEAFSTHLNSLSNMTRSKIDWIQDNMINPVYFSLCLTIPQLLEHLGNDFEIVNTCPSFSEDWRWFKQLHGDNKQFNNHFLDEYWKKVHNFLDYRYTPTSQHEKNVNILLEKNALALQKSIAHHEKNIFQKLNFQNTLENVVNDLNKLIASIPSNFTDTIKALSEAKKFVLQPKLINIPSIANMSYFPTLFGREVSYVSLLKGNNK